MFSCHGWGGDDSCFGREIGLTQNLIVSKVVDKPRNSIFQDQRLITTFFVPSYLYPFWPEATTKFQSLEEGGVKHPTPQRRIFYIRFQLHEIWTETKKERFQHFTVAYKKVRYVSTALPAGNKIPDLVRGNMHPKQDFSRIEVESNWKLLGKTT